MHSPTIAFRLLVSVLILGMLPLLTSCDSDSPTQSSDNLKAKELCTQRGQISCDRAFRCLNQAERQSLGLGYASEADCLANLVADNNCENATVASICPSNRVFRANMVDWCVKDLLALSCNDFFNVTPPACTQVCTLGPAGSDTVDDFEDQDGTVDFGIDQTLPDLAPDAPVDMVPGDGACQGRNDQDVIRLNDVDDAATECGIFCITEPLDQQPPCIEDCLTSTIRLSPNCTACYVDDVICARDNCLPDCIGENGPRCRECRELSGCTDEFLKCAGPVP